MIESFKATLMHAKNADVLLHVIDSSSPEVENRIRVVDEILEEIGCGDIDIIRVFNKVDIAPDRIYIRNVADGSSKSVLISATQGENMEALVSMLKEVVRENKQVFKIKIDMKLGKLIAEIQKSVEVISCSYTDHAVHMEIFSTSGFAGYLSSKGVEVETVHQKA